MKKAWVISYPLGAQRRLWSDWADAQADLSLRWAHSNFVDFVMRRLICGLTFLLFLLVSEGCILWLWHTLEIFSSSSFFLIPHSFSFNYAGSVAQRLVAFHWVYPSVDSGLFGRKAVPDIDVLIVDKSYVVSEIFKQGSYLLMKPTSNPGYVRLYKGNSVRSRCISSKGFRKYWRGFIDEVELFTRLSGRSRRFPERGKSITGALLLWFRGQTELFFEFVAPPGKKNLVAILS